MWGRGIGLSGIHGGAGSTNEGACCLPGGVDHLEIRVANLSLPLSFWHIIFADRLAFGTFHATIQLMSPAALAGPKLLPDLKELV